MTAVTKIRVLKVDCEDKYYGWAVGSVGVILEESDTTCYCANVADDACVSWLNKSDVEILP